MDPLDWRSFRKSDISGRRRILAESIGGDLWLRAGLEFTGPGVGGGPVLDLADAMVENAWGVLPIPIGLAGGFLIDGRAATLPMATEEPSVIAAASYAATIVARHGGFETWSAEPVMAAQVFLEASGNQPCDPGLPGKLLARAPEFQAALTDLLAGMTKRGGGWRGMDADWLDGLPVLRVQFHVDTRDAMGANLLNGCAERLRPALEQASGLKVLMAILSNAAHGRLAGASCRLPVGDLGRGACQGLPFAERIALASRIASADPSRGITHNKGIMNGISALALATGNDTRAIEAAAHAWAARDGRYRSLSAWKIEGDSLVGRLELPLPFAAVGGATGCHPAAALNLALAGADGATGLARAAAALGLAQNLAALQALVGEGIQAGHMKLHDRRSGWKSGFLAGRQEHDLP
jgi:hydroxymethylglutaryl-CoA reductase